MSTSDYVGPEPEITKQMVDRMYAEQSFTNAKALLDVVRYEEVERLFLEINKIEKETKHSVDEHAWWHKHEDRELTQKEVYCRALDDVMNILDERLGILSA